MNRISTEAQLRTDVVAISGLAALLERVLGRELEFSHSSPDAVRGVPP